MRHDLWTAAVAALLLAGCGGPKPAEQAAAPPSESAAAASTQAQVDPAALKLFAALPQTMESATNPITPEKVALGRMLYYETRVSKTGDVSCYVCHPLHDYGTSHRATGVGHDHLPGTRNEPTVYNAAGHVAQFWDGRAPDVEAQALGPVLNPVEMGMPSEADVLSTLKSMPEYVAAFKAAFPNQADPVTFENFGRAIGAFERGLVTPSRWDAYLAGDRSALSAEELNGFNTFVKTGCAQCHNGAYVGGTMYQKAGVAHPWFTSKDPGRMAVTKNPADRQVFKVPSLRNVEETWPYFHDGSVQRLEDAVRLMAWHQVGKQLSDAEVASIVTWLRTLTGPVPMDYIQEPTLPPSPGPVPGRATAP